MEWNLYNINAFLRGNFYNVVDWFRWKFLPKTLKTCDSCEKVAQWDYAPSDGSGAWCDDCVPRGCSCNRVDENSEEQVRDDLGRLNPCVEYWFYEWGWKK